jgi:RNA polymerase sigma factor (sigma-70 family)
MRPFAEIVAEDGPAVMRVCRALLAPADADDAWSDTFLAALRAYPDLRHDANVRGWLVTIAHRKAIDILRKASRTAMPVGDVPDVSSTIGIPDPVDNELRAALAALPTKQRGAVIYHYLADLPYAEVGALLETSAAAARRSAADGIAKLRATFAKETHDEH